VSSWRDRTVARPLHDGLTALDALARLVLPVCCAGCGRPDVTVCRTCRAALDGPARWVPLAAGGGAWVCAPYTGPLARAVVAWKDRGRRDLDCALAAGLATALTAANAAAGDAGVALVVPVPSSGAARRRRGADVVAVLARRALAQTPTGREPGGSMRVAAVLRQRRGVHDQAGLGARERRANRSGSLWLDRAGVATVEGRRCLVVDDIVTTGATAGEAVRALTRAGAEVAGVAAVCATPRRP
jgi:predicted amidophosphoribosyltransferase